MAARKKLLSHSTQGIRDLLFEQIEMLRAGKVTPQELARISAACAQILSSARLDIEVAKYMHDYDKPSPLIAHGSDHRLT